MTNESWLTPHSRDASSTLSSRASTSSSNDGNADEPGTLDIFRAVYTGRKSWKTSQGGELVWPAELEVALIEGLEKYIPSESRETRLLGRFPMRNRFLSEYIYRKTGRRRTAKQVSSRLQQLREACTGKRLMELLSPCQKQLTASFLRDASYGNSFPSSSGNGSDVVTSQGQTPPPSPTGVKPAPIRRIFCIEVLPLLAASVSPNDLSSQTPFLQDLTASTPSFPVTEHVTRLFEYARDIRTIYPALTFASDCQIAAHSRFTVYSQGILVFQESTALSFSELRFEEHPSGTEGLLLYRTLLVPNYWEIISGSDDPTKYTIFQEIIHGDQSCLYSAKYTFAYPAQYATLKKTENHVLPAPLDVSFEDRQVCLGTDAPLQGYRTPVEETGNYPPYNHAACPLQHDVSMQGHAGHPLRHLSDEEVFNLEWSSGPIYSASEDAIRSMIAQN